MKEIIAIVKQDLISNKDAEQVIKKIKTLTKKKFGLEEFSVFLKKEDYLLSMEENEKIDLLTDDERLTKRFIRGKPFKKDKNEIFIPITNKKELIGAVRIKSSTKLNGKIHDLEIISTLIGLIIIQNKLNYSIIKRYRDLELLYKISSEIIKTIKLDELLQKTINLIRETFGYDNVAILLLDENYTLSIKRSTKGFNKKGVKLSIQRGEGITGLAGKLRKVIISNDVEKDKRYIEGSKRTKAEIAIPLLYNDKLLGVLNIESNEKNTFSEEDVKILQSVANLLSGAVENALLYKKMEELAEKDELTGLYNYRVFRRELSKELSRAKRYGKVFSLAMFDIDYFKEYNDNNGHDVGNIALKKVGAILKKESRFTDLPARFGGEEFIVILPETSKDGAFKYAERVRKNVEETKFPGEEKQPNGKLTISGGVAEFPDDGSTPEQILKAVDVAAYKAKNSGRNCIAKYNGDIGGEN